MHINKLFKLLLIIYLCLNFVRFLSMANAYLRQFKRNGESIIKILSIFDHLLIWIAKN